MDIQQETKLALELADALNDRESLQAYLGFTRKYSETFLRRILTRVLAIPESKIKKTRGALFTFLVKQQHDISARP